MLFNSLAFAIYLPTVFILFWIVFRSNHEMQNITLLLASFIFYSFWDWRFLFLLSFTIFLDYCCGILIYRSTNKKVRKIYLLISVFASLGTLVFFKYFNFFVESFSSLLLQIGLNPSKISLNIILPVGISFYTFHGLSYVFDIYSNRIRPTFKLVNYALFVSFFPLLVAGPIERANHLLPQVSIPKTFNYSKATDGLRQILWGLVKKVIIADTCAQYVDLIFDNPTQHSGSTLLLGAFLFSFQIYGDFSGYTDIALGVARLFGFELFQNFNYPYFSKSISEFWKRWHISLSSWFKDYLYIPLGGNRRGKLITARNTLVVFAVSGLWHGANWTFLFWGIINGILVLPSQLLNSLNKKNLKAVVFRNETSIKELFQIVFTFLIVVFIWIFFRSNSIVDAFYFISKIFTNSFFDFPHYPFYSKSILLIIALFIFVEWLGRRSKYAIECIVKIQSKVLRWMIYMALSMLVLYYFNDQSVPNQFIYFQF